LQIASRWNFAFFTTGGGSEESKLGAVRAIQMEFETTVSAFGARTWHAMDAEDARMRMDRRATSQAAPR
jgi:hypothetical protein